MRFAVARTLPVNAQTHERPNLCNASNMIGESANRTLKVTLDLTQLGGAVASGLCEEIPQW